MLGTGEARGQTGPRAPGTERPEPVEAKQPDQVPEHVAPHDRDCGEHPVGAIRPTGQHAAIAPRIVAAAGDVSLK